MKTILDLVRNECELYSKQVFDFTAFSHKNWREKSKLFFQNHLKLSLVHCQPHLFIPQIEDDFSISLSNGSILSVLIIFYTCDADIDLSDICLQESVGFEESVENLNLIKEFCEKIIPTKPFYFNFEDFLYSPQSMCINKLTFIAELFFWFEVQPLANFITTNHFDLFKEYIKKFTKRHFHATTPFISSRIGDVTRNSFIKGSFNPSLLQAANNNSNSKSNDTVATNK